MQFLSVMTFLVTIEIVETYFLCEIFFNIVHYFFLVRAIFFILKITWIKIDSFQPRHFDIFIYLLCQSVQKKRKNETVTKKMQGQ